MLKYAKRVTLITITVFAAVILNIFSFYTHQAQEPKDCAVVFGAAVWPGYYGPVPSHALADRTLAAASLYKADLVKCIVLSGADSIYGAHEVDIMTDMLLVADVPEGIIELDRDGTDTYATIKHLDKSRSYILVSNDFHLARIGLLAQRAGLSKGGFAPHAAPYVSGGRYYKEPYFLWRETVAYIYYFFTTLF